MHFHHETYYFICLLENRRSWGRGRRERRGKRKRTRTRRKKRRNKAEIPNLEATWLKATRHRATPICLGAKVVPSYGDPAVSPALPPNLPGPRCPHMGKVTTGIRDTTNRVPSTPLLSLFSSSTAPRFPHQQRVSRRLFSKQMGKGSSHV